MINLSILYSFLRWRYHKKIPKNCQKCGRFICHIKLPIIKLAPRSEVNRNPQDDIYINRHKFAITISTIAEVPFIPQVRLYA